MRWSLLLAVGLLLAAAGGAGAAPGVTVDNPSVEETNVDVVVVVTATLSAPSSETIAVPWKTVDGTADATDYVPDAGTVTFAPGQTQARIAIMIKGDALDEANETFFVDVDGARSTVTILDDVDDRVFRAVVDARVAGRWIVGRGYTRVARLAVTRAPAGASVDVVCRGGGCPFRAKAARRNLTPLFKAAKLRPRATVQITVDSPGQLGKRFVFKVRAGKQPVRTESVLDY